MESVALQGTEDQGIKLQRCRKRECTLTSCSQTRFPWQLLHASHPGLCSGLWCQVSGSNDAPSLLPCDSGRSAWVGTTGVTPIWEAAWAGEGHAGREEAASSQKWRKAARLHFAVVCQSSPGNLGPGASIPVSMPWMLAQDPGIFLMLNFMILSNKIPI